MELIASQEVPCSKWEMFCATCGSAWEDVLKDREFLT